MHRVDGQEQEERIRMTLSHEDPQHRKDERLRIGQESR